MKIEKLKKKVYQANKTLVKKGLVIFSWGNVSAIDRKQGIVVIKPRAIEYRKLKIQDMSVVDIEGKILEGRYLPSVDLEIHLALYKNFKEIGAIAHSHSTYATIWSQAQRDIPALGTTHADHFLGDIPCTRNMRKDEVEEEFEKNSGNLIVECLVNRNIDVNTMKAVLLAGHGPFTWGKNAKEAVLNNMILEELAKLALFTEQLHPNLSALEQYLLEKHFYRKNGKEAYFYQK